jgi:hypothetical protein
MLSSIRQALCVLLVLGTALCVKGQTSTQKLATASISGRVTVKGKPAAGVMVFARDPQDTRMSPPAPRIARTDETGSYRISNLPAGTYQISSFTPALVSTNESSSIVVSEGEQVEDAHLTLVPGGVISGKITDPEGKPLIAQYVKVTPVIDSKTSPRAAAMRMYVDNSTDDRGIYRAFGLAPGKYKVSVGDGNFGRRSSREFYTETFYPAATDAAKATIIEVTEGSETNGIDIVMARQARTFRAIGRVIDGETGKPIPKLRYGRGQRIVHDRSSSSAMSTVSGEMTDANGEFRLENLTPGNYTVFTVAGEGNDLPSASVSFEIVDRDLTDLLIKTTRGSSLSGVVVFEGDDKPSGFLNELKIAATVDAGDRGFPQPSVSAIGQGGGFRIDGVRSGQAHLSLVYPENRGKQFQIARVERNGVPGPETINVKESEHIAGIRVVVKVMKMTGMISGQVKVENGELPPISQLMLSVWPLEENLEPKRSHSLPSPELDARGRFLTAGLPAGPYRISVYPRGRSIFEVTTQQVMITDDTVTEVTVILKRRVTPK